MHWLGKPRALAIAGIYNPTTNPTGVSIKGVAETGKLTSATNDCLGRQGLGNNAGSLVGAWSTNAGTPALVNTKSTLNITQSWGGTFGIGGFTLQ